MKKILPLVLVLAWWVSGFSGWLYWVRCVSDVGIGGLFLAAIEGVAGPIQWPVGYYLWGPGKLPNVLVLHRRDCCKVKP